MAKTAIVTARLDQSLAESLEALAIKRERTRGWLVAKAVQRFVEEEEAFSSFLKEGEDAIERGDFLTHEAFMAEFRARKPSV